MNSNGLTVLVPSPRAMINLSDACKALARATTGLEVKKIRDIAVAMAAFARAQQHGQAAYYEANEIRVRAERRYGELRTIAPAKVTKREAGQRGGKATANPAAAISAIDEASGVDPRRAREWEQLAKLPEDVFEEALRLSKEEQREHASTSRTIASCERRPRERQVLKRERRVVHASEIPRGRASCARCDRS